MRLITFFIQALVNLYSFSANPNLFGSKKIDKVAGLARTRAEGTQTDMESLQSMNPFETAAAKSAMAKASRTSKQMQNRMFNMMGDNASPEAVIAAQGTVNEGLGATAGAIAAGAEANKDRQIMQLRGLKEQQMGEYGQQKNQAVNTNLKGWSTVFQGIDAAGGILEGIGGVKTAFKKG